MAFDRELAFYKGFPKATPLEKRPNGAENIFWHFCLILYQNSYKTAKFYVQNC